MSEIFVERAKVAIQEFLESDLFVINKTFENDELLSLTLVIENDDYIALMAKVSEKSSDTFIKILTTLLNHLSKRDGYNKEIEIKAEVFDEY